MGPERAAARGRRRPLRRLLAPLAVLLFVPLFSSVGPVGVAGADPGTVLPGTDCPAFPADNVWNTPITGLPVNADSATWLASMDASTTYLHPDYGPSGNKKKPYGIPWEIVPVGHAARPHQVHLRRPE